RQNNSFSFSDAQGPWIETVSASGSPYQWSATDPPLDPVHYQIVHATHDPANQVIWHPMYEGKADIVALLTPFSGGGADRAAKAVTYEVVDGLGQTHTKTGNQSASSIKLGSFVLGKNSVVRLKATGASELALAGPLRIVPANGSPFEIRMGTRSD